MSDAESVLPLRMDAVVPPPLPPPAPAGLPWAPFPGKVADGRRSDEVSGMPDATWREDWSWAMADVREPPESARACGAQRATSEVRGATSWRWNGISSVIAYMHDEGMKSCIYAVSI